MSDWLENLKRYALSDDMDYRLTWEDAACALEEIERLRKERDVWKANAETNLGELERANKEIDSLIELLRRERLKTERMQAALERKDYW